MSRKKPSEVKPRYNKPTSSTLPGFKPERKSKKRAKAGRR